MCGIVGISAETNVAGEIYDSLLMLQHRGQDAAGMVVCDSEGNLNSRKAKGYVRDAFRQNHFLDFDREHVPQAHDILILTWEIFTHAGA